MFSRPTCSKLKQRWNSRLADVKSPEWEDPGPCSAEPAWAGGWEGCGEEVGVRHDCVERTYH